MGRVNSHALYLHLVEDLSDYLPVDVYAEKQRNPSSVHRWPDMTKRQMAAVCLLESFFKKFIEERTPEAADKAALDKFLSVNKQVGSWSLQLQNLRDEYLIGELKKELYNFFYPKGDPLIYSFHQLFAGGRTGPGSSLLANGADFYSKMFSSPLSTTTEGLYEVYLNCTLNDPIWSDAEQRRIRSYGEASVVPGNRLNFVPKNVDISRVIATEPNLNMFFQLGLGSILEGRLRSYFGIDLAAQPDKNRTLARIGSQHGSFATIDLSSASDSMSLGLVKEVIPREQLAWFLLLRSPNMELPDGSRVDLEMLSTMGNGYTFPLQTALFASIVVAAARLTSTKLVRPRGTTLGNFAVFGDDIIVPTEMYGAVVRLLTLCGFTLNSDKSFFEGPFRESCGADFYDGFPVRGVYVKTLCTQESRYVLINRLNQWSAVTGIKLPRTVRQLLKKVRYQPVPLWENDDAGIKVPYQMVEKLKLHTGLQSIVYRRQVVRPKRIAIKDGVIVVPRGHKHLEYNPSGLLLAVLRGVVRNCTISVRLDAQRYSSTKAIAPSWDMLRLPDFGAWASRVCGNLLSEPERAEMAERLAASTERSMLVRSIRATLSSQEAGGQPSVNLWRLKAAIQSNMGWNPRG